MSRTQKAIGVLLVTLFGLWGCTRASSVDSVQAEKLKALEAKLARLEDEFRAVASARDQLSKKLMAAEQARTELLAEIAATNEQLRLRTQELQTRTQERDQVTDQYKAFRDQLRELLARGDEGKMSPNPSSAPPVIPTSNPKPDQPAAPADPMK